MKISKAGNVQDKTVIFRLFVAGDEPHSKKAKDNLRTFCASHLNASYKIEVMDVFESFKTALEHNIFLTPSLIKVAPGPAVTLFGDLSDTNELIKVLGLEAIADGR